MTWELGVAPNERQRVWGFGISKPALAALWPNQNNMNVVLDLGANIECNEKNLVDFACMGSAFYQSIFKTDRPKISLLNVGLEEYKGNDILKKTFSENYIDVNGMDGTFIMSDHHHLNAKGHKYVFDKIKDIVLK